MGDIDCWGFEPAPTLSTRKSRYEEELKLVSDVYDSAEQADNQHDFLENKENNIYCLSAVGSSLTRVTSRISQVLLTGLSGGLSGGSPVLAHLLNFIVSI